MEGIELNRFANGAGGRGKIKGVEMNRMGMGKGEGKGCMRGRKGRHEGEKRGMTE